MDPRNLKLPTLSVTIPKTSANPVSHINASRTQSSLAQLINLAKEARKITQISQKPVMKPKGPKPVDTSHARSASIKNPNRKVVASSKPAIKDRNASAKARAAIKQKESKDAIRARLLRSLSQESRSGKNAKTAKKAPLKAILPSPGSPVIRTKPAIAKIQQRVEKRGRPLGKKNKSAKRGKSTSKPNKGIARTGKVEAKIARKQEEKAVKQEMEDVPDLPEIPSEDEDLRDSIEKLVRGTRSRVSEEKIIQRLQNQFYEVTGEHVKGVLNRLVLEGILLNEKKDFYTFIKKRDRKQTLQQKTKQRKQPKRQQKKDSEEEEEEEAEAEESDDEEDEEEEAQIEILEQEEGKDQMEEKEVAHDPVDDVIDTLFVKINEGVMEEEDIGDKATQSKSKAEIEEKGAEAKDSKEEKENPPQNLIQKLLAKINKGIMGEKKIGDKETQSKPKVGNGEKGAEEKDKKEEKKEPAQEVIDNLLFKIGEKILEEEDIGDKETQSKPKAGNEEKGAELKDSKEEKGKEHNPPQNLIQKLLAQINKGIIDEEDIDIGDKETQSKSKAENEEKRVEEKDSKEEKEEIQKEEQSESAEEGIEILIVKEDEGMMEEEDIDIGDKETQSKSKAENEEKGAETKNSKEEESKKEGIQGENNKEEVVVKPNKEKGDRDENDQKNDEQVAPTQLIESKKQDKLLELIANVKKYRKKGSGLEEEQTKLEAKKEQDEDVPKQDKDENQKNDEQVLPTQLIESNTQGELPVFEANIDKDRQQEGEMEEEQGKDETDQKHDEKIVPTLLIESDEQVFESNIEKDRQEGDEMEEEQAKLEPKDDQEKDETDQKNDQKILPTLLIEQDEQGELPESDVNIEKDRQQGDEMEEEQGKFEPKEDQAKDENDQKNDEQIFPTLLIEQDEEENLPVFKANIEKERQQGDEMEEEQGKLEAKDEEDEEDETESKQDKDESSQKNDKQVFLTTLLIESDEQGELSESDANIDINILRGDEMEEEQSKLEAKSEEKDEEQDRSLNQGSGDNSVPGFSGQAGLTGLAEKPEEPIQSTLEITENPLKDITIVTTVTIESVTIEKVEIETVKQLKVDEMEEELTVPDDPQMELERQKELDGEGDGDVFNNMMRDGEISSEGKENRELESEPIDTEDYEPAKVKKVKGEKDQLVPLGEQQLNRSMDQIFG